MYQKEIEPTVATKVPKLTKSTIQQFCSVNVNKINNESKQRKIKAVTNNEYIFVQFDNVSHIVSIQLKTPFTVRCGCQTKSTIPEWCEHIVQALLYLSKEVLQFLLFLLKYLIKGK